MKLGGTGKVGLNSGTGKTETSHKAMSRIVCGRDDAVALAMDNEFAAFDAHLRVANGSSGEDDVWIGVEEDLGVLGFEVEPRRNLIAEATGKVR